MKILEKIRLVMEEYVKNISNIPGIRRIEALKRAIIKVKMTEKIEYSENGPIVDGLIGSYNPNNCTY